MELEEVKRKYTQLKREITDAKGKNLSAAINQENTSAIWEAIRTYKEVVLQLDQKVIAGYMLKVSLLNSQSFISVYTIFSSPVPTLTNKRSNTLTSEQQGLCLNSLAFLRLTSDVY